MKGKYFLQLLAILLSGLWSYGQVGNESPPNTDYNNIEMPESPTAAAFGKVDEVGVNTATGVPNITIPLYTFELDGVSVPISISYKASGIKVNEVATSVGMNWSLNAGGQISRTVRAKADEDEGWFDPEYTFLDDDWYLEYNPNAPESWHKAMTGIPDLHQPGKAKLNDHMPDQFNYSFGNHSGSFIYTPDQQMIKEKTDGVRIYYWDNPGDPFKATDLDGNNYEFWDNHTEIGKNELIFHDENDLTLDFYDWEGDDGFFPVTAWKLSKIATKNNKTIFFDYENVNFSYTEDHADSNITLGYACAEEPAPVVKAISYTKIIHNYNTRLIDKISSPNGNIEITFTYGTDPNLPEGVWATHLDEITIIDHTDAQNPKKRGFRFQYGRYSGDPRLRLDRLYEVWYINEIDVVEKHHYIFSYKPGSLPSKTSKKRDFFGYFNNSQDPSYELTMVPCIVNIVYPWNGFFYPRCRDMSVNSSAVDVGILSEIQYPTGGRTVLEFEPNQEADKYMGGLRIESITQMDGTHTANKKIYDYTDLRGFDMEDNRQFTIQQGASGTIYNSSFSATPGTYSGYRYGFFYGKVSITSIDSESGISFKEEHYYEEDGNDLQKFDFALKAKHYFKENNSTPVKTEEYHNSIVGTPTNFEWNILGETICYTNSSGTPTTGYDTDPTEAFIRGDYAFLPTQIVTTDFLGTSRKPVTTVKKITYDPETLLKTKDIIDTRYTRQTDGSLLEDNPGGEVITTTYQYPWSEDIDLPDLPPGLPISKIVHSNKHSGGDEIFGQYFEYDANGNIKSTYQYNKGEAGATNPPTYVDPDYEFMSSFTYSDGKPVQVIQKNGVATSYIWGFKSQYPLAKIEGKAYASISSHVATIHNICNTVPFNETNLVNALNNLRNAYPNALVTTFTYDPLYGVKTITDPKGDTITYHYDTLGRLEYVTDKDDNRLSENEYNYRPQ